MKALHLVRPSEATEKAARARDFDARMARVNKKSVPMLNATMPGQYRTGDGETVQQVRPGSMHAYTLPSRGIGV